jgi:hypothetical protein
MMREQFYLTKSGFLVVASDRKQEGNRIYLKCHRLDTGGFHGWLRLERLEEVKGLRR